MSPSYLVRRILVNWKALAAINARTLLVIGLAAFLGLSSFVVLLAQVASESTRAEELRERLTRSVEIRAVLRMAFSALQDAAIGERGYILTGDAEFLEPYEAGVKRVPGLMEQLLNLTTGTAKHLQALQFQELSSAMLAIFSGSVTMRQNLGLRPAIESVSSKRGKHTMDRLRDLAERMIEEEDREISTVQAMVRAQTALLKTEALLLALGGGFWVIVTSAFAIFFVIGRRRSELELAEARLGVEEATNAKSDFLASMSHEIRTPLHGIIGYTEWLRDTAPTPEQRRCIERIEVASSALLTIVNDILDLSQIEAGRLSLEINPFSLEALIDSTTSIVSGMAQMKGLSLQVTSDPKLPDFVIGDEARLRQVLLNLLNNAIKFTNEGQITFAAQLEGRSHELEVLRFSVSDTGIGIPSDKQDRLFKRFSQVDNTVRREFGGTGLGLAIAKRLIEFMGGQIGLESERGIGSTFWIRVALARAMTVTGDRRVERSLKSPMPARILVVEDLEINQKLTQSILETAGHKVDIVVDGIEALAAVQAQSYDLVLMDVQMPRMDGIAATKEIRALDHPASRIPIIAMTANVLPQQVRRFKEAGMNDHVGKPMKRNDLIRKVNEWLFKVDAGELPFKAETPVSRDTFDQQALDELHDLMGRERVAEWLIRLKEQLNGTFSDDRRSAIDREQLASRAHALASQAALLGFLDLARRCRELEDACSSSNGLSLPFEEARTAARTAHEKINTIVEQMTRC